jgi:glycosyltransferase involved in cell wall biosynthesis
MKITQIVPSLESRHGGPSRSVRGLAEGLADCGHTVELLTTGPLETSASPPASASLSLRSFPRSTPEALARSPELASHLSTHSADIIHNHGLWQRPLHYARAAARSTFTPLVISPRGMMSPWAWKHRRWKKSLAATFVHPGAFAAATGWHATSEAEADDIRRLGFTQPVCVAPNGVIAPSSAEETEAARYWHEHLPALAGRRVALFYSRLHSKKRIIELIDLWVSRPRGDWVLLIVGIPEQYSVNQLDAYLIRCGALGRIIVHDGTRTPPPYAVASLFLLPSHSENFGLVVAEALVRGVPVLTTDGTPWSQLETHGAGRCVSWDNYGTALESLLASNSEELHASGQRAREWAVSAFSWTQAAATLVDFYRRLRSA